MKYKIFGNERGGMAALLSVIVLSMIMVSTLASFYIYLENRAKFQNRIRITYQTGYVMDDMARAIAQATEAMTSNPPCPVPNQRFLDCAKVCMTDTTTLTGAVPSGTPKYAVCVKSDNLNKIVNNADYFCAFDSSPSNGATIPGYCAGLVDNNNSDSDVMIATTLSPEKTNINNWYSRLDQFFDTTIVKNAPVWADKMSPILESRLQPPTVFGWLLPQTVYAYAPPPPPPPPDTQTATGGVTTPTTCQSNPTPECSSYCNVTPMPSFCKSLHASISLTTVACSLASTDPRCKKCTKTDRLAGDCTRISLCPPWVDSKRCAGSVNSGGSVSSSDMRIHQLVRVHE